MLKGKNVTLLEFTDAHMTSAYLGWLNDPEVNRFLCTGRFPVFRDRVKNLNSNDCIFYAVFFENTFIGTCSINRIDLLNRNCQIGYMIGNKDYWGRGVATEIIGLMVDYALNRLGCHTVEAGVVEGNVGSIKALEKNGFAECGVRPEVFLLDGEWLNVRLFARVGKK